MATHSSLNSHFSSLLSWLYHLPIKNDLSVTTKSGQVQGKVLLLLDGEVRAFLGIPYGRSPVGDLCFRVPQPTDLWQGMKNATNYANSCFEMPD